MKDLAKILGWIPREFCLFAHDSKYGLCGTKLFQVDEMRLEDGDEWPFYCCDAHYPLYFKEEYNLINK